MPFTPAKCTQCGANLQVDSAKDAAICEHCGTAFIVEKAINHYNTTVQAQSFLKNLRTLRKRALEDWLATDAHSGQLDYSGKYVFFCSRFCDHRILELDPNDPLSHDIRIVENIMLMLRNNPFVDARRGRRLRIFNDVDERVVKSYLRDINSDAKVLLSGNPDFDFSSTLELLRRIYARNKANDAAYIISDMAPLEVAFRNYLVPVARKHILPPFGEKVAEVLLEIMQNYLNAHPNDPQLALDRKTKIIGMENLELLK